MIHPPHYNDTTESTITTHQYDPRTDSVSEELLNALTTIQECQPTEIDPLAYTIDPEALNALVSPRENGVPRDGACAVKFEHGSHHVRVTNDGSITIQTVE